jgi:hypothetical protein
MSRACGGDIALGTVEEADACRIAGEGLRARRNAVYAVSGISDQHSGVKPNQVPGR